MAEIAAASTSAAYRAEADIETYIDLGAETAGSSAGRSKAKPSQKQRLKAKRELQDHDPETRSGNQACTHVDLVGLAGGFMSTVSNVMRSAQQAPFVGSDLSQRLIPEQAPAAHNHNSEPSSFEKFNETYALHEKRLFRLEVGIITLIVFQVCNFALSVYLFNKATEINENVSGANNQIANIKQDYVLTDDFQRLRRKVDGSVSKTEFEGYQRDTSQTELHLHESMKTLDDAIRYVEGHQSNLDSTVDKIRSDTNHLQAYVAGLRVHVEDDSGRSSPDEDDSGRSSVVLKDMRRESRERNRRIEGLCQALAELNASMVEVKSQVIHNQRSVFKLEQATVKLKRQLSLENKTIGSALQGLQTKSVQLQRGLQVHIARVDGQLNSAWKRMQTLKDTVETTRSRADHAVTIGNGAMASLDGICFAKSHFHECPSGSTQTALLHWYHPDNWDPWCGGAGDEGTEDRMDGECVTDTSGNRMVMLYGCCRGA